MFLIVLFNVNIGVSFASLSMLYLCAWYHKNPEEGVRSPGSRVKDGCELPVGAGNQIQVF